MKWRIIKLKYNRNQKRIIVFIFIKWCVKLYCYFGIKNLHVIAVRIEFNIEDVVMVNNTI